MVEHVCGLQGFGLHLDDICPACEERNKPHMEDDKNPFAFPVTWNNRIVSEGMTLRDYFAAAALTGFLAAGGRDEETAKNLIAAIGPACYGMADQLLAERTKETPE